MTPSSHEMDAGEQRALVIKERLDLVLPFFWEQLPLCFRETEIMMRVMPGNLWEKEKHCGLEACISLLDQRLAVWW
jgi:hypothetical protein